MLCLFLLTGGGNEAAEDLGQHGDVAAYQEDHDQHGTVRGPQGGAQASAGGGEHLPGLLDWSDHFFQRLLSLSLSSSLSPQLSCPM